MPEYLPPIPSDRSVFLLAGAALASIVGALVVINRNPAEAPAEGP